MTSKRNLGVNINVNLNVNLNICDMCTYGLNIMVKCYMPPLLALAGRGIKIYVVGTHQGTLKMSTNNICFPSQKRKY